jgi:hypothetical protein
LNILEILVVEPLNIFPSSLFNFKILCQGLGISAHTCNPSYSGGRDQEDPGSKPACAEKSRDPILKTPNTKKGKHTKKRKKPNPLPELSRLDLSTSSSLVLL